MSILRVVAVENISASSVDTFEPAIACVYKDDKLQVYDTFGELYYQREYFEGFDSLKFLINKGKYQWTDFMIEKGKLVTRDTYKNITIDKEIIDAISPLAGETGIISDVSVKLFYRFLEKVHKNKPIILQNLILDFSSGEFKRAVEAAIRKNPMKDLLNDDSELIVRCRIEGMDFIANKFKEYAKSTDPLKIEQMTYYFSRIFKLETANYIRI